MASGAHSAGAIAVLSGLVVEYVHPERPVLELFPDGGQDRAAEPRLIDNAAAGILRFPPFHETNPPLVGIMVFPTSFLEREARIVKFFPSKKSNQKEQSGRTALFHGGPYGDRTHDLQIANLALSQLS